MKKIYIWVLVLLCSALSLYGQTSILVADYTATTGTVTTTTIPIAIKNLAPADTNVAIYIGGDSTTTVAVTPYYLGIDKSLIDSAGTTTKTAPALFGEGIISKPKFTVYYVKFKIVATKVSGIKPANYKVWYLYK